MATINITGLGAASTPVDPNDLFHISQGGVDYNITIAALQDEFGKVDIFGLSASASPEGTWEIPVYNATGAVNQKITIGTLSNFLQEDGSYVNDSIALIDKVIFRKNTSTTLSQTTVTDMRDLFFDFSTFAGGQLVGDAASNNLWPVYKTNEADPTLRSQYVNTTGLRNSVLNPIQVTQETNKNNVSWVWVDVSGNPRKISVADLQSGLGGGGGGGVDPAASYNWTGSHTWSQPLSFNTISPFAGGTTLTINHTGNVSFNSNIQGSGKTANFANFKGKFIGNNGSASNGYLDFTAPTVMAFKGSTFAPTSSGTNLGTTSLKWDLFADDIDVATKIKIPTTGLKVGSNSTDAFTGTSNDPKVNIAILPDASIGAEGVSRMATAAETRKPNPSALQTNVAVSANILAQVSQLFGFNANNTLVTNVPTYGTDNFTTKTTGLHGNATIVGGSFQFAGLTINYGKVTFSGADERVWLDVDLTGGNFKVHSSSSPTVIVTPITTALRVTATNVNLSQTNGSTLRIGAEGGTDGTLNGLNFISIGY